MLKLRSCGNPNLLKAINRNSRNFRLSDLDDVFKDGVMHCKWCAEVPTPTKKHLYCSDKCRVSAHLMFNPQSCAGRAYLLFRQRFLCACGCGFSWREKVRDALRLFQERKRRYPEYYKEDEKASFWFIGFQVPGFGEFGAQVDHIIPVSDGGETYGFDNCQVLRESCHLKKTARERSKIHKKCISS